MEEIESMCVRVCVRAFSGGGGGGGGPPSVTDLNGGLSLGVNGAEDERNSERGDVIITLCLFE